MAMCWSRRWLLGLACVAFDYAAAEEVLQDGVNGSSVPFGDEDTFVARVVALAQDKTLLARFQKAGPKVGDIRSWQAVVNSFEQALYRALHHSSQRRLGGSKR